MRKYIEENIIPRYDAFDAAHRRDHVIYVIEQSLEPTFPHQYITRLCFLVPGHP